MIRLTFCLVLAFNNMKRLMLRWIIHDFFSLSTNAQIGIIVLGKISLYQMYCKIVTIRECPIWHNDCWHNMMDIQYKRRIMPNRIMPNGIGTSLGMQHLS